MRRVVLGSLGAVTALFPREIIALFEKVAIRQPERYTRNSWAISAIRTEGIIIMVASLIGGKAYAGLMNLTGLFGLAVVLNPDAYRQFATNLLYEHPDTVEWNDQFSDQVRLIGILYILFAVRSFTKRRSTD